MKRSFNDKRRGVARRKRKPVMFISLEGNNKTEKQYFKSLNDDHGQKYSLKFTPGRETDLQNMWHTLHDLMSEVFSARDGDKAFCICDRDHEAYKLDRIRELKQEANRDDAKIIVSNPCFEIWFLNHFRYSTRRYHSVHELMEDMCRYIPYYEKKVDYYQKHLKSNTSDAITNSIRQIEQVNGSNSSTEYVIENPGTEIAKIVQMIISG